MQEVEQEPLQNFSVLASFDSLIFGSSDQKETFDTGATVKSQTAIQAVLVFLDNVDFAGILKNAVKNSFNQVAIATKVATTAPVDKNFAKPLACLIGVVTANQLTS